MDPITTDFENDLDKIIDQLDFIEIIRKFSSCTYAQEDITEFQFLKEAIDVHERTKKLHGNLPLVSGTLILYTCGRFEMMTRTLFEDLCQRLVTKAGTFSRLPKKMRDNLPIYTAMVISEPRKFGHAENGVRTFVTTLASNLAIDAAVDRVNHECLSVTDANMRADVLSDLFGRVGVAAIWTQISEQAALKIHFQSSDSKQVEAKAKRKLNELMELRNKIAHPSGEFDWPSIQSLRDYIDLLRLLARAMAELVGMYELTLCQAELPVGGEKS
ncbi:MAG: HEPN domain-containing protein [Rhodoferax sp.]|nr:HEPN domain-containing protein [Rhodoferax sp.]